MVVDGAGAVITVRVMFPFLVGGGQTEGLEGVKNGEDVCLDGGFKYFYFHPYLGKTPILTNIFPLG